MKLFLAFFILLFASCIAGAQNLEWANSLAGSSITETSIESDAAGNVYVCATASGALDVDPGPGVVMDTLFQTGMLLVKYDPQGNYVLHVVVYGPTFTSAVPVILTFADPAHLLVIGNCSAGIDFDPGVDTSFTNVNGGFVAKYDMNFNLVWMKNLGTVSFDNAVMKTFCDVDDDGSIYLTGQGYIFSDLDPDTPVVALPANGIFFAKYDSTMRFQFVKAITGPTSNNFGTDIKTDALHNIYLTGTFRNTIDVDPGPGVVSFTPVGVNSFDDVFVASYAPNGDYRWAFRLGNSPPDHGAALQIDDSANVYIAGNFSTSSLTPVDFDPGPATAYMSGDMVDVYVAKYDSSGHYRWVKKIGGVRDQYFTEFERTNSGDLYLTGWFYQTTDFDPGIGNTNTPSDAGSYDLYVAHYDSSMRYLQSMALGSAGYEKSMSMALGATDGFYIYGNYSDSIDCDPSGADAYLYDQGSMNLLIARYTDFIASTGARPLQSAWKVFPSPAGNMLYVTTDKVSEEQKMEFMDLQGRMLLSSLTHAGTVAFDVSQFPDGVYLVKTGGSTRRVVIIHEH